VNTHVTALLAVTPLAVAATLLAATNVEASKESVRAYTAHGAAGCAVAGNLVKSTTRLPPAARPESKAKYKLS
jgi:hypothetical protein